MSSPGFQQLDTTVNTAFAVSPTDGAADLTIGIVWAASFYAIGMIWTALALIDRWRGPHGTGTINFLAVVAAFLLAIPWPFVLVLMALM